MITPPLTLFSGISSSNIRDLVHLETIPRRRPSDKPFPISLTEKMTLLGQATLTYYLIRAADGSGVESFECRRQRGSAEVRIPLASCSSSPQTTWHRGCP